MNSSLPKTEIKPSVCPLDCADTCSLDVEVADGQVKRVRGSDANPFTRGKICAKVAQGMPSQVHGKARITQPLLRSGPKGAGAFEPVSWERALDEIYQRFSDIIDRFGAQAIAPLSYGGPMGLLAGGSMDKRFFHRLGASLVDSTPLCAGTSAAAWESVFGDVGGIAFEELSHSKLIVVWGNNITACNLHLTTLIRDAQKQGSTLVVIDPKRTRIADSADLFLPVRPGTDVVLAYAVAALLEKEGGLDAEFIAEHVSGHEAFLDSARQYTPAVAADICGLEEEDIRRFAQYWRELSPAAISMGVAPERNRNGGSGIRAAFALPALTGNFGQPGAGVCDVSGYFPVDSDALSRPDLAPKGLREFNVLDMPDHILTPGDALPLKAVFIYNHNPVAVHPRQSLMREALQSESLFVVGSDVSMTDSMAYADVILPASTHLEYGDLYQAYGHQYLQRSEAVIPPVGDAKSNMEIFRLLAQRFGFGDTCFTDTDANLMDQAMEAGSMEAVIGAPASQLPIGTALDVAQGQPESLLRGAQPDTPSGRIELFSQALEDESGLGVPAYRPLIDPRAFQVVTPASERRVNSTFGALDTHVGDMVCEMNPTDAGALRLSDGQPVRLFNEQGDIELPLLLSDRVRLGTVYVPKGAWLAESPTDQTVNALIPGHKADMAGGACYYDCTVDISAA